MVEAPGTRDGRFRVDAPCHRRAGWQRCWAPRKRGALEGPQRRGRPRRRLRRRWHAPAYATSRCGPERPQPSASHDPGSNLRLAALELMATKSGVGSFGGRDLSCGRPHGWPLQAVPKRPARWAGSGRPMTTTTRLKACARRRKRPERPAPARRTCLASPILVALPLRGDASVRRPFRRAATEQRRAWPGRARRPPGGGLTPSPTPASLPALLGALVAAPGRDPAQPMKVRGRSPADEAPRTR